MEIKEGKAEEGLFDAVKEQLSGKVNVITYSQDEDGKKTDESVEAVEGGIVNVLLANWVPLVVIGSKFIPALKPLNNVISKITSPISDAVAQITGKGKSGSMVA